MSEQDDYVVADEDDKGLPFPLGVDFQALEDRLAELDRRASQNEGAAVQENLAAKITAQAAKFGAWLGAGALVLGTIITGLNSVDPPVNCGTERSQVQRLVERESEWSPLPEDSPIEEQCDLNGYVSELQDNDDAGGGGGGGGGNF